MSFNVFIFLVGKEHYYNKLKNENNSHIDKIKF